MAPPVGAGRLRAFVATNSFTRAEWRTIVNMKEHILTALIEQFDDTRAP
jgi:hypothetical protein